MAKLNPNHHLLNKSYLFPEIEKRLQIQKNKKKGPSFLNLGIGDVSQPLGAHLLSALCHASQEMGSAETFQGYGPSGGYPFLKEKIARYTYPHLGITSEEIFISNGAKNDLAQIQELFARDASLCVCDPSYPVYIETNLIAGRTLAHIHLIGCYEEEDFLPQPPQKGYDFAYLCSPNNPTGVAFTRKVLSNWVQYALEHHTILIFDGAYEAYISSENCPHSIYEIDGAKGCAIEIRSFSKSAGFTNLRCSYTVIPKELKGILKDESVSLHSMWKRRQDTKFGGVPYPIQKCAAAIYTPEGEKEVLTQIGAYQERTKFLREGLEALGFKVYGGRDAPYVWCKTPNKQSSWDFFDFLLEKTHIVSIPGSGFGRCGEGYVRFSAFADPLALREAILRLKCIL